MNLELCLGGPGDGEIVEFEGQEAPEKWIISGEVIKYVYKKRETSKVTIEDGCVATLDGPIKYDYQGWEKVS